MHTAVAALVRSWSFTGEACEKILEDAAKVIQHWQGRIAAARKSHTKTTREKLEKMGIRLQDLKRCIWPSAG